MLATAFMTQIQWQFYNSPTKAAMISHGLI